MIKLPTKKPNTICIYEKPSAATEPGTEMNVTPEIAAPTIANAAMYHGVLRAPVKKLALSALRPDHQATKNSTAMYASTVMITEIGDIEFNYLS